jgi:CubicO group peptidase (beta-lactamase class C family)
MCSTTKAFTTALLGLLIEEAQRLPKPEPESSTTSSAAIAGDAASSSNRLYLLKEKGWQTPVSAVLGGNFVANSKFVTDHATLEDLASHRSGIIGHDMLWGPWMGKSLRGATRAYRDFEPVKGEDFRVSWNYNNLCYATLGQVVEVIVGGQDEEKGAGGVFAKELRERVLKKLGMEGTWMGVQGWREGNKQKGDGWMEEWARPYFWRKIEEEGGHGNGAEKKRPEDEKGYFMPEPHLTLEGIEPAGALISSVEDYAKWARAMLHAAKKSKEEQLALQKESGGEDAKVDSSGEKSSGKDTDDDNPISPSLYRTLTTPRLSFPRPFPNPSVPPPSNPQLTQPSYALGWILEREQLPGHTIVVHGGGLPGIGTVVALLPEYDFGFVCAANSDGAAPVCEALCRELFGARVGLSEEERRKTWEKKDDKGKEGKEGKKDGDLEGKVAPIEGEEASSSSAGKGQEQVSVDLDGKWHHPAYGTFQLSHAGAAAGLGTERAELGGVEIVREKKQDSESKDVATKEQQQEPWVVEALGRRALHYRFLLHPHAKQPEKAEKLGVTIFDQEELWAHGEIGEDVFPELDRGWPKQEKGSEVQKALWGGHSGVKKGAAIAEADREGKVRRLGLTLWRRDYGVEGQKKAEALQDGWEDERIWFTPVDKQ